MNRKTYAAMIICILAGSFMATSHASAQETLACGDEIEQFCSHVTPGKLSMAACLNENREKLSKECLVKVDKALVKIEEARKICGEDISRLCAEVKPGDGRILNCLNARKADLAPGCRKQVEKFSVMTEMPTRTSRKSQNESSGGEHASP